MSRSEPLRGCLYAGALLWINAYVCRNWLFHPTAQMQTLDGAWSAVARLGEGWLHPSWWPFWDCGIPLEFASAPLVPALARALAAWRNVSHAMALQTVSALFYCAAPLALFLMAWLLTRAPGHAFFAGLFYSLLSPAQILAPEGRFSWAGLLDAHRLLLQSYRDQTPRAAALTFLLLFIVFLARSFEKRRPADCTAAAVLLALAMLATPLAILPAALSACCLLAVLRPDSRRGNLCLTAAIVASALALAAPWLPPSLWLATAASSAASEPWTMGPFTALLAALTGWLALTHYLPRWTGDWRTQFFALFAWLMSCGPICAAWLQRQWLPRPDAFRIEMEPALALAAVFGTARLPRSVQVALAAGLLCLAGTQIVHHRRLAKDVQYPAEVRKTVESRASRRVAGELPGVRVLLPASMANWANAWTEIAQVSGSGGAATHNPAGRLASKAVYGDEGAPPEDARIALAWLKALGAGAVVLPSPGPLDAALEKLWREGEASAYRVPQRTRSLARVAPENALVRHSPAGAADTAELERFAAALDDPSLPEASFEWQGRNAIRIRAVTAPGQAISVQVSHHPGWHARVDGRPSAVRRDGLGLMWLRPDAPGAATVELHYDGGLELRLCRWLALATLLAGCVFLARGAVR